MRLTVGPMPPSVYWRRRAIVAGAILAVILVVAYSCSGGDDPDDRPTANPTKAPAAQQTAASSPPAPAVISPNASDPSSGIPANAGNGGAGNGGSGVTGEGATGETCGDSEIDVTAVAENATVRQGGTTTFYIRIKNVSTRLCSRDLSAQAQELYLEQNSAKQWSSDTCSNAAGSNDVRRLQPGEQLQFFQAWSGQATAQGCGSQALVKQGTYQLRARLGSKVSEPVTVTVTG